MYTGICIVRLECHIVLVQETDAVLRCYHPMCQMTCHTLCLAKQFLRGTEHMIPVDGSCPSCKGALLWGDLIRYKMGCKDNLEAVNIMFLYYLLLFVYFNIRKYHFKSYSRPST